MASADLDYIRALLIAQTAEPEPRASGPLSRLFSAKADRHRSRPLALGEPAVANTLNRRNGHDPDQELLLDHICGLEPETASPLPPPAPRAEFGRRPDAAAEIELMLVEPVANSRRLRVLDDAGAPVGEMILHPQEPAMRAVYSTRDEAHVVPYFPEDFCEPEAPPASQEPQPLRPWIKALRNSAGPPRALPLEPATSRQSARTARTARTGARQGLGRDLLDALALSLSREHEALADRLLAVTSEGLFRLDAIAAPAAT